MLILLNVMGLTSVFGALSQETLTFFNLDQLRGSTKPTQIKPQEY